MANQLELIAQSYDEGIELGRKGIDSYNNLPEHITSDPDYHLFEKLRMDVELSDSGRFEIQEYLSPDKNMSFIDLGCCLNLMFKGYDTWASTYHGVDISEKTIELLNEYTAKHNIPVGELFWGSIHETPFDDNYFDIGACIGVLEYFEKDFVKNSIVEFHRVMKPDGKFVLDVPNMDSPVFAITMKIEEYLGRPDKYNMSSEEFESILRKYFHIVKKENVGPMTQYFLRCR